MIKDVAVYYQAKLNKIRAVKNKEAVKTSDLHLNVQIYLLLEVQLRQPEGVQHL